MSLRYLALLLLGVVLSGCGEQSAPRKERTVQFHIDWTPGIDYAGAYVAREKGFFKEAGFDVSIIPGNGAEESAALMSQDRIGIGTTTADALLRLAHTGNEQLPKVAAVVFTRNPVVLVASGDTKIRNLPDLKGKRIGFSEETSVTFRQFSYLLNQSPDLKRGDVELVKVLWDGPRRLMAGDVDAVLGYATDVPVELEANGFKHSVIRLELWGIKVASQVVAVSSALKLSREETGRFVEAMVKGWEYARNNGDETVALLRMRFPALGDARKLKRGLEETVKLLPEVIPNQAYEAYTGRGVIERALQESDVVVSRMETAPKPIDIKAMLFN